MFENIKEAISGSLSFNVSLDDTPIVRHLKITRAVCANVLFFGVAGIAAIAALAVIAPIVAARQVVDNVSKVILSDRHK